MFDYIIVQAGGKGSRLQNLTYNKPKALVSINNLPMIFHLFKLYPDKKFIIIGDYKFDVLEKYLNCFAPPFIKYQLVNSNGNTGTLAGLNKAISLVDDNKSFLLIWCDLVLGQDFKNISFDKGNWIGLSKSFPCRWRYLDGVLQEVSSNTNGVAGFFVFENKQPLSNLPESGEFVRYLSGTNIVFNEFYLPETQEYGLKNIVDNIQKPLCRPFNKLTFLNDRVIKEPIDEQGRALAKKEVGWYKYLNERCKINSLPKVYNYDPLTIEKVGDGSHLYEMGNLSYAEKQAIVDKIIQTLKQIHNTAHCKCDYESFVDAYLTKTINRLNKVINLIPFIDRKFITINGKSCRNILFFLKEVSKAVFDYIPNQFSVIHGDATFSNILLDGNRPVIIDPRGYFGKTDIFGDEAYDYAKLYYSIAGNYDQFNLGNFTLKIDSDSVTLDIQSSKFEDQEDFFFKSLENIVSRKQIVLYHSIIWYSLTTYAWNDYDSICGAFYKGCLELEKFFEEDNK